MLELGQIVFLGFIATAILWFGVQKGFFHLPSTRWDSQVTFGQVAIAFAIYFGISIILVPIYIQVLRPHFVTGPPIAFASWINFLNSASILVALGVLFCALPKVTRSGIWFREGVTLNQSTHFKMAFYAWLLAFPVVIFLTSLLEEIVLYLFNIVSLPDQLAVYFVKMTFEQPYYFIMSIITIVIITPFVEETLFRGFLQSYIRRQLGPTQAIFITAACFALFHFSYEQGLANIPIVGSLFALALFLGFIYEKQGTLFASIYLHALFNGISILNLYFLGGIPCFF